MHDVHFAFRHRPRLAVCAIFSVEVRPLAAASNSGSGALISTPGRDAGAVSGYMGYYGIDSVALSSIFRRLNSTLRRYPFHISDTMVVSWFWLLISATERFSSWSASFSRSTFLIMRSSSSDCRSSYKVSAHKDHAVQIRT